MEQIRDKSAEAKEHRREIVMIATTITYQGTPTMADIEYFYSAHSAFAYFGSARLMEIARVADSRIIHKPIDLNRDGGSEGGDAEAASWACRGLSQESRGPH